MNLLQLKLIFETELTEKKSRYWENCKYSSCLYKRQKKLVKNYHPINLLPLFSKIFEKALYNSLCDHLVSKKLFTPPKSGFLPGDSCTTQFLSIIHEVPINFDNKHTVDVRGVFLDIFKAFDKVWP